MLVTKVLLAKMLLTMSKAGATVKLPDGGASDWVPSGKAGLGVALTDDLGAYGEVSFVGSGVAGVDRSYGTKAGLKYTF
jgi:hypothetical protein